ncbi:MAG: flagellar hook-length control protein FliK, partial [Planctomycetia bacterium]|nr:flagellar hook-length control protein FliK [Planctomycetia bacterium]
FVNVLASTIDSSRSPAEPAAEATPPSQGPPAPAAPAEQTPQPVADSPSSPQPDSAPQPDSSVDTALAAELAAAASLPPAQIVPDRDVADDAADKAPQMPLAGCGAPPPQLANHLAQTDLSQTRAVDPDPAAGAASDLASAPAAVSTAVFAPASLIAGLVQPEPDSGTPAAPSGAATKSAASSPIPATIETPAIQVANAVLPALASAVPVPRATSATTAPASTDETAPSAPASAPAAASASPPPADAVIAALAPNSDARGSDSGSTAFLSSAAPPEQSPSSVPAQAGLSLSAAGSASLIAGISAANLLPPGDGAANAGPATGPGAAHSSRDADPANPATPAGPPNPETPVFGAAPQSLQLQGTTVAAQQTTAAPTHPQGVVNQVAYAIQYSHESGQGMQLHLTPPELGSVQVDVSVRDGVLSARLEAQSAVTRQILTDNLTALKESLTQQGVTFDRIDVGLAGSHTGSGSGGSAFASLAQQQEGALPWDQQYPEAGADEASVVPQPNLRPARAPLTALDIMV